MVKPKIKISTSKGVIELERFEYKEIKEKALSLGMTVAEWLEQEVQDEPY